MPEENRPHEEGGIRSGGPLDIVLGVPDCDCPQSTAWRLLCSSTHVLDLISEYAEWDKRRIASETSRELSAAGRWSGGTSYALLERRRNEPPPWRLRSGAECIAQARASWAEIDPRHAASR